MSEKRRDKRNRILRNGESQRSDGRYAYVYVDSFGKQRFLYSWKPETHDPVPAGKRNCISLREKEKKVLRDLDDGIVPYGGNITVIQLVKKYLLQKTGVRPTTTVGYKTVLNKLEKDPFCQQRIDKVKLSNAKEWLIQLQKNGMSYSALHNIRGVVRPAFQMAVEDDMLRKNPFEFQMCTVVLNDSVIRQALTAEQQRKYLEFIKNGTFRYKRHIRHLYSYKLRGCQQRAE